MWYFVVFQPSKCKKTHFQPQIWSIWPIFPKDSESLPKFCYIKRKNSEILSKLRNSELVGVSASWLNLPPQYNCFEKCRGSWKKWKSLYLTVLIPVCEIANSGMGRDWKNPFPQFRNRKGMKKSIPIIREWESEAFILGNGREREFPLTPVMVMSTVIIDVIHNVQGTWVWSDGSSYSYNPGWVSNHPTTNTAQVSRISIWAGSQVSYKRKISKQTQAMHYASIPIEKLH